MKHGDQFPTINRSQITVIAGPPNSGKTTYARKLMKIHDFLKLDDGDFKELPRKDRFMNLTTLYVFMMTKEDVDYYFETGGEIPIIFMEPGYVPTLYLPFQKPQGHSAYFFPGFGIDYVHPANNFEERKLPYARD